MLPLVICHHAAEQIPKPLFLHEVNRNPFWCRSLSTVHLSFEHEYALDVWQPDVLRMGRVARNPTKRK